MGRKNQLVFGEFCDELHAKDSWRKHCQDRENRTNDAMNCFTCLASRDLLFHVIRCIVQQQLLEFFHPVSLCYQAMVWCGERGGFSDVGDNIGEENQFIVTTTQLKLSSTDLTTEHWTGGEFSSVWV